MLGCGIPYDFLLTYGVGYLICWTFADWRFNFLLVAKKITVVGRNAQS